MWLGITFPRAILFSRRKSTGLWLIRPKIAIAMQAYELHIRNLWAQTRIEKLIRMNKEVVIVECGRGK